MEPNGKDLTESDVGDVLSESVPKSKELEAEAMGKSLMECDEDEEVEVESDEVWLPEEVESDDQEVALVGAVTPLSSDGDQFLMETSFDRLREAMDRLMAERDAKRPEIMARLMAEKDAKRPEIMAKVARAQEARVRAINRILDIKASNPLSVLLRETVEVLVSMTQNKQLQDAFRALAFDMPEDYSHDHIYKLFPCDYTPPSCLITQDPLSVTPHTNFFPTMYTGFIDSPDDLSDCHLFPEFIGLLGKTNDDDGELTRLDLSYHRVARMIILLESLPSTPENAERIEGLRNYVYQMLRDRAAISISKDCIGFPFAIKEWVNMDISRLEAKLDDEMLKPTGDGYKMRCLQNEINDIRRLMYNTKDYFLVGFNHWG